MNALRFIFTLFDRMSGPARRIRDSLAGVRRELGRTNAAFNQFYSSTSGLRHLAASVGAGVVGMTAVATAGFAALAVKYASFKEQAETSFQVLLKNKAAGTALYNQAVKFASITPFDTQQVISSYQQLLSFNFKPVEIPIVLSGIGDLASIKGFSQESVNRITLAMGQIKAKGRLMGDEMMQLTEAGFSQAKFYEIVSKKMGVSVSAVRKLQEKGKLDSGTAIAGILETIRQTVSGGKLGGLMQKQSETLQGLWSTLASRPFEMLQNFDKAGSFNDLKAVIRNLGNAFDTTTPKGQAMSKALVNLADVIVGGIFGPLKDATGAERMTQFIDRVTLGVQRFKVFWAKAWPEVMAFFRGFVSGVRAGWQVVTSAFETAKPVINFISAFVGKLTGAKKGAGSTAEALGRLVGMFGVLTIAAGGLSLLLVPIKLLMTFGEALGMVWRMGRGAFGAVRETVKLAQAFRAWGGFSRLMAPVAQFFRTFGGWIARAGGFLGRFGAALLRIGGVALRFGGALLSGVGRVLPILGRGLLSGAGAVARFGLAFLAGLGPIGWVALAITGVIGVVVWAYNRFDWFHKAVNTVWAGITAGARAVFDGVRGAFLMLWGWISGDESASRTGAEMVAKFQNAAATAWNAVVTWALSAGAAVIDGIKQGIESKWNGLKATVTATANGVGEWFRNPLGIHSPSRVFAGFGGNIIDGLLNGIDAGKARISSTVRGVAGLFREMWLRHQPTLAVQGAGAALSGATGGGQGGSGVLGASGAAGGLGGLPSALLGKSNSVIANAALQGLSAGWAESLPGYCSRFVRQVFGRAIGPATSRLFGSSAIQTERNFKAAGLSRTLEQIGGKAGLRAGDVLFQGFGSGGFGHTGIYVGNGMVAQNTTAAGGGKKLLPLSAFGAITSVGRLPGQQGATPGQRAAAQAPAPRPSVPAPAAAPRRAAPSITIQNTLQVPKGTPEQQSNKLKADAHNASYQGAALALEQLAIQGGHK